MYKSAELNIEGKIIRGVVRTPEGTGPFPTVCFYHGFSVDKVGLMRLHELFARACVDHGMACVRFDFYGCGESDGDFSEMRFSEEVKQAEAIYRWTSEQSFCDKEKLFAAGHSLGGAITSVIAPKLQPKAIILWAPGNTAYYDISSRTGAIPGEYKDYYDIGGLAVAGEFLSEIRRIDIVGIAAKYQGKVLIVHGDQDEKVPVASIGPYLDIYKDQAECVIIRGSNHQFSSLLWRKQVYEESLRFLKGQID